MALRSLHVALSRAACASSTSSVSTRCASTVAPSKLFIANKWVDATSGKTFPVTSPHNGKVVVDCAAAEAADVDLACQAAYNAQWGGTWGQATTGASRSAQLHKMAANLRSQKEEWAQLETLDCGKTIVESRADVDACADAIAYFADLALELDAPRIEDTGDETLAGKVVREPAGVVAAITPWNFPLLQSVAKVAPALAAGCSVVLKPSASAPFTSLKLGELALDAGLPAGALNILSGLGGDVGTPLGQHPLVDRVSYTGSGPVGKSVMRDAADNLRFTTMELGGKGAIIVFDDYPDLDAAVDWIMCGIFLCTGQVCSATSRLLVQDGIKDALLEKLVAKVKEIRIGDPFIESTQMGPMVSAAQRRAVVKYIDHGVSEGLHLLTGGSAVPEGLPSDSAYVQPTIFSDVPESSKIWTEEIFGPVLAVRSFNTEQEAVQLANASEFGLGDAVLSADLARCDRVAARLRSGIVWQNCTQPIPACMPFGGFKQSGFGKEFGREGLSEYLQSKSIVSAKTIGYNWEWFGSK